MYFDTLTLAAVAAELQHLHGARIQRVTIPSRLSIALELYGAQRRHHLLISAHPRFARIHLCNEKPSRGVSNDTPMLLLLRKYLVGGHLVAIEQPDLERVLVLSIAKRASARNLPGDGTEPDGHDEPADGADAASAQAGDEPGEKLHSELVIEIMEQRSNIVLVSDENIILECVRRVTPAMSRRPLLPHEPYELPPAQEKRDPRSATAAGVALLAEQATGDLARALVGAYRGLSPLAAREVAFRSTGHSETPLTPDLPWDTIAAALRAIFLAPAQPSVAGAADALQAYAAYALTHLPGWRAVESMSQAIDTFYASREQLTQHQQRKEALRGLLMTQRERYDRQHRALSGELERARDIDRLRWEGEMIFAFLHAIEPGQTTLDIEGRVISLDPRLTPVEAAQDRFRSYEKMRSAIAGVPERLKEAELRLAGIDETMALLELAEGFDEIETIYQEAIEEGFIAAPGRRRDAGKRQSPLRIVSSDGLTIWVGRSAGQNQQVTFRLASSDDLWLHARGTPGAHVVIKNNGRPVPPQTLQEPAPLAAYSGRNRNEAAVDIDIARRSQVRRIRGGPQGLVSYHAEQSLRAVPRPPW